MTRLRSAHVWAAGTVLAAVVPALVPAVIPAVAAAQRAPQDAALASWIGIDAPTGEEARYTPALVGPLTTATGGTVSVDRRGNVLIRKGTGAIARVVACAVDKPGFAVTQITANGLLRLHRVGNASHALWDQQHEGNQLEILTANGVVPAVSAIANGHFAQQHRRDSLVTTADELWVDVGARSAADVAALGVRLLDPVQRRLPAWPYAGHVAGTNAGGRAGCAAVVAAARGTPERGTTLFVVSTQGVLGWPGLGAVLAREPGAAGAQVTVVTSSRGTRTDRWATAASPAGLLGGVNAALFRAGRIDSMHVLSPAVRAAGTLVESIAISEADWLLGRVADAAGVRGVGSESWVVIPARTRTANASAGAGTSARANDPHAAVQRMLQTLADLPGVPGMEWRVREAIAAQLPAWAKAASTVDDGLIVVL